MTTLPRLTPAQERALITTPPRPDAPVPGRHATLDVLVRLGLAQWREREASTPRGPGGSNYYAVLTPTGTDHRARLLVATAVSVINPPAPVPAVPAPEPVCEPRTDPARTATPTPAPEPSDVHVQSCNGGEVHTMMPGMDDHPWPLCRGGGRNQILTKFRTTTAPLSCTTCLGREQRRADRIARGDVHDDTAPTVYERQTSNDDTGAPGEVTSVPAEDARAEYHAAMLDRITGREWVRSVCQTDDRYDIVHRDGTRVTLTPADDHPAPPVPAPRRAPHDADRDERVTLLTIGHSTMTYAQLLDLLRGAGITTLVDVRSYPGSMHNPDMSRKDLAQRLPADGIAYRWEPRLGGRREAVPGSPDTVWRHKAFSAYAAHMRTDQFRAAMVQLLTHAATERIAIMCSENTSRKCHRRMITDYVIAACGGTVLDILPDGTLRPAKAMNGIRLLPDGTIIYDAPTVPVPATGVVDDDAEEAADAKIRAFRTTSRTAAMAVELAEGAATTLRQGSLFAPTLTTLWTVLPQFFDDAARRWAQHGTTTAELHTVYAAIGQGLEPPTPTTGPLPALPITPLPPIEARRALLRATIATREQAPHYRITLPSHTTMTAPWGIAMAHAQKTLRGGAALIPGPGGTFTLCRPGEHRRVTFTPLPAPCH